MQSTYTPGSLTTVIPGLSGPAGVPGQDEFMDMAKLMFQRRLAADERARELAELDRIKAERAARSRPSMTAEMSKVPIQQGRYAVQGGLGMTDVSPEEQRAAQLSRMSLPMQQRMMQLELLNAEERSRPVPKTKLQGFNMNIDMPDWSKVSINNMPGNASFGNMPDQARIAANAASRSEYDRQKAAEKHMDDREQRGYDYSTDDEDKQNRRG